MTNAQQALFGDRPWWAAPERVEADGGLFGGAWCQRLTGRRPTWRRTSDGGFNPRRYVVSRIGHHDAVTFVITHHYAGCYPSVKLRYGLVERHSGRLVGVCTIGTPCNQKVLSNPLPKLAAAKRVAELNRLVLLDEVESNGDSARCCIACNNLAGGRARAARLARNSIAR